MTACPENLNVADCVDLLRKQYPGWAVTVERFTQSVMNRYDWCDPGSVTFRLIPPEPE